MSFKYFINLFILFILLIILLPTFFIPTIATHQSNFTSEDFFNNINGSEFYISNSSFKWPIPGYTKISSYFGRRSSPTAGASSYHQGIDIPAPSGSYLVAPCYAIVTSTGFKGSGGYTITLKSNQLEFIYHHTSPNYIVKKGDFVSSGQIIGQVRS